MFSLEDDRALILLKAWLLINLVYTNEDPENPFCG